MGWAKAAARAAARRMQLMVDEHEAGQGLVEYTFLIGFIAFVCIVAVTALGTAVAGSVAWTIP